jgi:hypothetical protein
VEREKVLQSTEGMRGRSEKGIRAEKLGESKDSRRMCEGQKALFGMQLCAATERLKTHDIG